MTRLAIIALAFSAIAALNAFAGAVQVDVITDQESCNYSEVIPDWYLSSCVIESSTPGTFTYDFNNGTADDVTLTWSAPECHVFEITPPLGWEDAKLSGTLVISHGGGHGFDLLDNTPTVSVVDSSGAAMPPPESSARLLGGNPAGNVYLTADDVVFRDLVPGETYRFTAVTFEATAPAGFTVAFDNVAIHAWLKAMADFSGPDPGNPGQWMSVVPVETTLTLNGQPVCERSFGVPTLAAGDVLGGYGSLEVEFLGTAGSQIVAGGEMTLGDGTSYAGFGTEGTLDTQAHTVTLQSRGFANLGNLTTIGGGTLAAANGAALGIGDNLVGSGDVDAKIAAGFGSTIDATGDLTVGDAASYSGFISDGELYVNSHTVTLHDKNEAVLGSLTEIDGGTLTAENGFLLENGKNLTGTGGSLVNKGTGPETSRFLNRGYVEGPPQGSEDWLVFDLLFKASTGQTAGNIDFSGGYAPGDSPGLEYHDGSATLGSTSPFEFGGPTPGDGNGHYSQLNVAADLFFSEGAILDILPWDGYAPDPGEQFTILTWGGDISGDAAMSYDNWFADQGIEFIETWNGGSLVLTAVPEPSTFVLTALALVSLAVCGWRRRK